MNLQEADRHFIHTYNRSVIFEKGEGMYLFDNEGNKYLDMGAGIAVSALGYSNDEYKQALKDQIDDLIHISNLYYTKPAIKAAELICNVSGMDRVFFTNSGAEAIEGAIKLARKYAFNKNPQSKGEVIAMDHSFHGRTMGALSVTGTKHYREAFEPLIGGVSFATYNDLESVKALVTYETCAILLETLQGEGGIHPATPEFMKGLREFCDEKGMLLLIDEVQTGWCRTGAVMSYMNYGIKPDIVSMAKGLGGGMPIGAICATEEVAKAFTPGSHGTTFGGHPVCCAAALAEVGELLDRDLAGNAKKVGDYFAAKLEKLPRVKEVRHQGLLVGVEFDDTISGVDVKHGAFDRKMLITAIGAHIIRMVPPLIVSEEECDKAFEILDETVKSLS